MAVGTDGQGPKGTDRQRQGVDKVHSAGPHAAGGVPAVRPDKDGLARHCARSSRASRDRGVSHPFLGGFLSDTYPDVS